MEPSGLFSDETNRATVFLKSGSGEETMKAEIQKAAVCGLFCPSCSLYIATNEDTSRMAGLAEKMNSDAESLKCDGCRSERMSAYCRKCSFRSCAEKKGISFCSECGEYPCDDLVAFQSELPHRIDLWKSLDDVRTAGLDGWFDGMERDYTCEKCGTINSAYDNACWKCGGDPSCPYVARNHDAIAGWFGK